MSKNKGDLDKLIEMIGKTIPKAPADLNPAGIVPDGFRQLSPGEVMPGIEPRPRDLTYKAPPTLVIEDLMDRLNNELELNKKTLKWVNALEKQLMDAGIQPIGFLEVEDD